MIPRPNLLLDLSYELPENSVDHQQRVGTNLSVGGSQAAQAGGTSWSEGPPRPTAFTAAATRTSALGPEVSSHCLVRRLPRRPPALPPANVADAVFSASAASGTAPSAVSAAADCCPAPIVAGQHHRVASLALAPFRGASLCRNMRCANCGGQRSCFRRRHETVQRTRFTACSGSRAAPNKGSH